MSEGLHPWTVRFASISPTRAPSWWLTCCSQHGAASPLHRGHRHPGTKPATVGTRPHPKVGAMERALVEALSRGLPGDRVVMDPDVLAARSARATWLMTRWRASGVRSSCEALAMN